MTTKAAALARRIIRLGKAQGVRIAIAESCTGGMVSAALTDIPGSSAVFERAFITYSNAAKIELVGVPAGLIAAHGAVSAEVAGAMAIGALRAAPVELALSITGIAGPDGGSEAKPVGLVHFAVAHASGAVNREERRFGACGRDKVRAEATMTALQLLEEMLIRTNTSSA